MSSGVDGVRDAGASAARAGVAGAGRVAGAAGRVDGRRGGARLLVLLALEPLVELDEAGVVGADPLVVRRQAQGLLVVAPGPGRTGPRLRRPRPGCSGCGGSPARASRLAGSGRGPPSTARAGPCRRRRRAGRRPGSTCLGWRRRPGAGARRRGRGQLARTRMERDLGMGSGALRPGGVSGGNVIARFSEGLVYTTHAGAPGPPLPQPAAPLPSPISRRDAKR